MRRRYGVVFDKNGKSKFIFCVVTGEMVDGRKVWTECDKDKNPVNIGRQYFLQTRGGWNEFIPM